ncbi:MAG: amidohydrolase family protein, partial [Treponema sp.]|nr:amidohydrolase family protein [Treponema sp.]
HPFRLGKIAERFPELPILMVHMGGAAFADLSNACIEIAAKYRNITPIGSAIRDISILKGIQKLGCDRICFGSDTPFALMNASVVMYDAIMKWGKLSEENREKIMSANIKRVLKLS